MIRNIDRLDAVIEPMLRAARIPGAALAVVADGNLVFAKGYGYRDLGAKLPVTAATVYHIASTSKAFNATLLGMLVDEGVLEWDAPVQRYLPQFRLGDSFTSAQVTLRDLVTMRTGLPRHDWMRVESPMSRAELVERLRYLDLSAGFRERFQYNNLTVTAAGHVAEVVTGKSWEELVRDRILVPLGMNASGFAAPANGNVTLSYHENSDRELKLTQRLETQVTAPSGGAMLSTVQDMAQWMLFNLDCGRASGCTLIHPQTLREIHSPQIAVPADPAARKTHASYALGWTLDVYSGCARVSHGGYLHDVNSEVSLFPEEGIGIVLFTNFGPPMLALLINQYVFDTLRGLKPPPMLEDRLAQYEKQIEAIRRRDASLHRGENTSPSHSLQDYAGMYGHAGYGQIEIRRNGDELVFHRGNLILPLSHWRYDAWAFEDADLFEIHQPHAFDRASRLRFLTNADGGIGAVSIPLEPAVAPILFEKQDA